MTVAVAHQVSASSRSALEQAVQEARNRDTDLAVLHVADSLDRDREEAYRLGVGDQIETALGGGPGVPWQLHLATAGPGLADTLLGLVDKVDADLLVIGARRRSPVGKAILGSVAQTVILRASIPVLVVKAP